MTRMRLPEAGDVIPHAGKMRKVEKTLRHGRMLRVWLEYDRREELGSQAGYLEIYDLPREEEASQ